jgi:hypothetical protein
MFYGIVTQTQGAYTERQLRAYPIARQRIEDGATAIPASRIDTKIRRILRTPHVASLHAGGIVSVIISKAEAEHLARID